VRIVASCGVLMPVILYALAISVCALFKWRRRLQAENRFWAISLILHCGAHCLGLCPGQLDLAQVVKPETILRGHRAGCSQVLQISESRRATEHRS
jgi:hypothetical protein